MSPLARSFPVLSLLILAGCPSAPITPATPARPPLPESVVDWARGSQTLAPLPATGDRAALYSVGLHQPIAAGQREQPDCVPVTEVLPAPSPDGRKFALDTEHAVRVWLAPGATLEALQSFDPALGIQALLGFARLSDPLELLVAARPHGGQKIQLWKLTVAGRAVLHQAEVTGAPSFASMDAFFAAYTTPRCGPGGHDCLLQWHGPQQWMLEVETRPLGEQNDARPLGNDPFVDAVWAVPNQSMYVLVRCQI
jgi:hypothetical protein